MVLLMVAGSASAQSHFQISGRVLDRKTGKPLAYANISIKNANFGTVTNDKGEFEFFVPTNFKNDTLSISYIGYKPFVGKVIDIRAENQIFYLDESPIVLQEVIISSEDAKKIVEQCVKSIQRVYPSNEFMLEGFYREWFLLEKSDGSKVGKKGSVAEAAVAMYDKGYSNKKSSEEIYVNEIRKIQSDEHNGNDMIQWVLKQDAIKHPKQRANFLIPGALNFPNDLSYEVQEIVQDGNDEYHVISVSVESHMATYTLFISKRDHALMRIDLTAKSTNNEYINIKQDDSRFKTLSIDNTIRFKRLGDLPYLNYVRMHWTWIKSDSSSAIVDTGEEYAELIVNHILIEHEKIKEQRQHNKKFMLKHNETIWKIMRPYNGPFWQNYNVKVNELNPKLMEALGQPGKTLVELFEQMTPQVKDN
ncbi:MAG TPA: carboxypeptidase-like regulatory domain-containing protein [Cyclobacteriaceae bacterium]|nr:carboxypeptidase-like regulatory domain-containing protein [Cyclobacteriaceae bacterium]